MLAWPPGMTTAEIHLIWMTYYESYDRAVALTNNLQDVTLIVPAQDWATRFTEMQEVFPPWVTSLIVNYPGRFTSMTTCWAAINAEALRQAASRSAARMFQLADAGEMMYADDFPLYYEEAGPSAGSAICAMGRNLPPDCWRCGEETHLCRECPHPASEGERRGMPLNTWAKQPGRLDVPKMMRGAASSWSTRGLETPAVSTANIAQMAALTARVDRQEAMFEAVLERFSALAPPTSGMETLPTFGGGPVLEANTAAPVMQMAAPGPVLGQAPLIVGGAQPEGYIYVGTNHGQSIWRRDEVVAASVTEVA